MKTKLTKKLTPSKLVKPKLTKPKQLSLVKMNSYHQYNHGGILRNKRLGRKARSLSSKDPIHLVFKANKITLRKNSFRNPYTFVLITHVIRQYSRKFFIKIEKININHDHLHLLIRGSRRSLLQSFFKVVAGQISQRLQKDGLLRFVTSSDKATTSVISTRTELGVEVAVTSSPPQLTSTSFSPCVTDTPTLATATSNQRQKKISLWRFRPFTRVVKGYKAYKVVRDYITLNELEVTGTLKYQKHRLKQLTEFEWKILWSHNVSKT